MSATVDPEHIECLRACFTAVHDGLLHDLAHDRLLDRERHRHAVVQYADGPRSLSTAFSAPPANSYSRCRLRWARTQRSST
jgi:hypothetical protein